MSYLLKKLKKYNHTNLIFLLLLSLILTSCFANFFGAQTRRHIAPPATGMNIANMNVIKKKIVVLPFLNESPFGGDDLAFHTTEYFKSQVLLTPEFVIEQTSLTSFGTSKEVYAGGGAKLSQLVRQAKNAGINLVIYGRITEARVRQKSDEIGLVRKTISYAQSHLEIRIFDVHSNKEIFVQKNDGNINDSSMKFYMSDNEANLTYRQELLRYSLRVAAKRFMPQIVSLGAKLDWTGRIAKILGNKIYINAGRKSGLNVGDILKVMTEAQEIFDPETGAMIGVSKGDIKATLEIIDFYGADGAIAVVHSGGTITEGDFVQLY